MAVKSLSFISSVLGIIITQTFLGMNVRVGAAMAPQRCAEFSQQGLSAPALFAGRPTAMRPWTHRVCEMIQALLDHKGYRLNTVGRALTYDDLGLELERFYARLITIMKTVVPDTIHLTPHEMVSYIACAFTDLLYDPPYLRKQSHQYWFSDDGSVRLGVLWKSAQRETIALVAADVGMLASHLERSFNNVLEPASDFVAQAETNGHRPFRAHYDDHDPSEWLGLVRYAVRESLSHMPGDQRALLWVHYVNEVSMADVSRGVGVSRPTITARLRLAVLQFAGHPHLHELARIAGVPHRSPRPSQAV